MVTEISVVPQSANTAEAPPNLRCEDIGPPHVHGSHAWLGPTSFWSWSQHAWRRVPNRTKNDTTRTCREQEYTHCTHTHTHLCIIYIYIFYLHRILHTAYLYVKSILAKMQYLVSLFALVRWSHHIIQTWWCPIAAQSPSAATPVGGWDRLHFGKPKKTPRSSIHVNSTYPLVN